MTSFFAGDSANRSLSGAEWTALAFGVLTAHGFLLHEMQYPSYYDAYSYLAIAKDMVAEGLFHKWPLSEIRTYGYPFFLSLILRGSGWLKLPTTVMIFGVQLALYVAAGLHLRRQLSALSPQAARIAFCGLLFNYYVLVYAPVTLTESVSLTLTVYVAACWLRAQRAASVWPILLGSLAAGFSVMVRPANLFLVGAWMLGMGLIVLRQHRSWWSSAAAGFAIAVCTVLPWIPQYVHNYMLYGAHTPIIVANLPTQQWDLGVRHLKYATGMPPVMKPAVIYENPLIEGTSIDAAAPWKWYLHYPLRGAKTVVLHVFNMLDQDLLFTYSRDLDPPYRIPLGVINHAAVALGLAGAALLALRTFRPGGSAFARDGLAMLALVALANIAIYGFSQVEMRFGATLLLELFPLAGYSLVRWWRSPRALAKGLAVLLVAAYVVAALALSDRVRDQAPLIHAAMQAH